MRKVILVILVLLSTNLYAQTGDQLAITANAMSAGTWAQVPQNSSINVLQSNIGTRLTFAGQWGWDYNRKVGHFLGQFHGDGETINTLKYFTFDEASNNWTIVCGNISTTDCGPNPVDVPGSCVIVGQPCGPGSGHGYYHTTVDPLSGTVYHKVYGASALLEIIKYPIGGPWTLFWHDNAHNNGQDACNWAEGQLVATNYNTGADPTNVLGLHSDNGGSLRCFFGETGYITAYSPRNQIQILEGQPPNSDPGYNPAGGGYQTVSAYSRICNCWVYGGGNGNLKTLIRLDADQTVHAVAASPIELGVDHGGLLTVDPVSGHFIAIGYPDGDVNCAGTIRLVYEYDGIANTWTPLTGANIPPAWGAPGVTGGFPNMNCGSGGAIAAPADNLGAIVLVTSTGVQHQMWLFKVHGQEDFSTRCNPSIHPGVILCVGFDSNSDLGVRGNHDATQVGVVSGSWNNIVGSDCSTIALCPVIDNTIAASGAGSLHFQIPSSSNAGSGGQWMTNFKNNFLTGAPFGFGAGSHFFVAFRQRMSSDYVNNGLINNWGGGGGWKQAIITVGDPQVPAQPANSCQLIEQVPQNTNNRGFPQFYNGQPGCSSGSPQPAKPFEEPVPGTSGTDLYIENARANPYCLYSQQAGGPPPPSGNCFLWPATQWVSWLYEFYLGPRGTDGLISTFTTVGNSTGSGSLMGQAQDFADCGTLSTFNISWSAGTYTVTLVNPGTAYNICANSHITFRGTRFGGASPANDLVLTVTGVLNNQIGAAPNDEWINSHTNVFFALDGGYYQQLQNYQFNANADLSIYDYKYGKVFLLPYDTNRAAVGYNVADTWYDELEISTTRPAPPLATGATVPDTLSFCAQPSNIVTGNAFSPPVAVCANFSGGGLDTGFTGVISLGISGCTSTLTTPTSGTATAGKFTYTGLGATGISSNCILTATAPGLNSATSNLFNVISGAGVPVLSSISPNTVSTNATTSIALTGTGLTGATTVNISGLNITTSMLNVTSDSTMTFSMIVAAAAVVGSRTLSVTTPGGTSNNLIFSVTAAPSHRRLFFWHKVQ